MTDAIETLAREFYDWQTPEPKKVYKKWEDHNDFFRSGRCHDLHMLCQFLNLTTTDLLWLRDNSEPVKAIVRGEAGVFPTRLGETPLYYLTFGHDLEEEASEYRLDKPAQEGR